MTGLLGSPLNVLCKQHAQREFGVGFSTARAYAKSTVEAPASPFPDVMHYIQHGCAIYDSNGALVPDDIDTRAEEIFNKLLEGEYPLKRDGGYECEAPADGKLTKDEMDKIKLSNPKDVFNMDVGEWRRKEAEGERPPWPARLRSHFGRVQLSFRPLSPVCWLCSFVSESGLEVARKALGIRLSPAEQKLFDWHAANLEYGCATALNKLSLVYWDQDDAMAWEGDHALIKPGFVRKEKNKEKKRQAQRRLEDASAASARSLCSLSVVLLLRLDLFVSIPIRVLLLINLPPIWTFA